MVFEQHYAWGRAYRLSHDEITVLKYAAHRQLTRWAHKRDLSPHQQTQRAALARAVRVREHTAFRHGCQLHGTGAD
jgi:hypothetical protein